VFVRVCVALACVCACVRECVALACVCACLWMCTLRLQAYLILYLVWLCLTLRLAVSAPPMGPDMTLSMAVLCRFYLRTIYCAGLTSEL
jgi:hypothetical protein